MDSSFPATPAIKSESSPPLPALLSAFDRIAARQINTPLAYGLAIACTGLAYAARLSVAPPEVGFPWLAFYPAVLIAAFFGGLGPGIVAAILGGVIGWVAFAKFIVPPTAALPLFAGYCIVVALIIAIIHTTSDAIARMRVQQAELQRLLEQQRTMFHELQHRVANNMQFAASLLSIQKRKALEQSPAAALILDDARERLVSLARIHRRLYDPQSAGTPLGILLHGLCVDLIEASGHPNTLCRVEGEDFPVNFDKAVPIALVVTEVVTNALKHAFNDDREGLITIALPDAAGAQHCVEIIDNGGGLPVDFDPNSETRLGMRIIHALAKQIGGTIQFESNRSQNEGTKVRLTFSL